MTAQLSAVSVTPSLSVSWFCGVHAGTGIGLTVVRDLVALHGGRSWVEPGERGGARFVVEFPTVEPAGAPS